MRLPPHDHVICYFMEIDAEITPCQLSQSTFHLSPNEYVLQSQVLAAQANGTTWQRICGPCRRALATGNGRDWR